MLKSQNVAIAVKTVLLSLPTPNPSRQLDEQQQAMFQLAMELEGFNKRHYNEPFTETTVVEDLEEVTDMETLLKYVCGPVRACGRQRALPPA